jgi:hypothetical protein
MKNTKSEYKPELVVCKGCRSFVDNGEIPGYYKCLFNISDLNFIPNCVCKDCLVKVTCNKKCSEFFLHRREMIMKRETDAYRTEKLLEKLRRM